MNGLKHFARSLAAMFCHVAFVTVFAIAVVWLPLVVVALIVDFWERVA